MDSVPLTEGSSWYGVIIYDPSNLFYVTVDLPLVSFDQHFEKQTNPLSSFIYHAVHLHYFQIN